MVLGILALALARKKEEVRNGLFAWIEFTLLALAAVLYGTEPFILILQTIVFQHPAVDTNNLKKEDTSDIALIISCHKSADVIVQTCECMCINALRINQVSRRLTPFCSFA